MITVGTVFYRNDTNIPPWGHCYTEEWVDKLYRGIQRNYSQDFNFICLTDKVYTFKEKGIWQLPLIRRNWHRDCLQLHALPGTRLVLMGLDTVITGSLDEIFAYAGELAVPRDPYLKKVPCNAVVLQHGARPDISIVKSSSDMTALESFKFEWLDDLFPGDILSYKVHVKNREHGYPKIVYFHGIPKPHEVTDDIIVRNWI